MTVKGGKHQLTGIVSLGGFYNSMKKIELRTYVRIILYFEYIHHNKYEIILF